MKRELKYINCGLGIRTGSGSLYPNKTGVSVSEQNVKYVVQITRRVLVSEHISSDTETLFKYRDPWNKKMSKTVKWLYLGF
jgi:hypothetical protein